MIVTIVEVYVKPEHVDEFIAATLANHRGSVQEPGNLRFDVLRHRDDPACFSLYEAYESEEAAARHRETAHFAEWLGTVTPWLSKERKRTVCSVLAPEDAAAW